MKKWGFIFLFMVTFFSALAQSGTVRINNGKIVEGDLFKEKLLIFDNYVDGRIRLKDNTYYTSKLNINTMTQSLRVISEEGDTIIVNFENMVDVVSAGNMFLRKIQNSYIQILNTDGDVSLGLVRKINMGKEKLVGAYGGTNEVSSIAKVSSIDVDSRFEKIVGSSTLSFDYVENLFLLQGSRLVPATRRNFERMFSKKKSEIRSYVDQNNTRFNKKEEVAALFNFLTNNQ